MTQPEKSTETSPPTKQSKDETSSPAVSVGGVSAVLMSLWLRGCTVEIFLVYTVPGTFPLLPGIPGSVVTWVFS